jgi:hypothetical protein
VASVLDETIAAIDQIGCHEASGEIGDLSVGELDRLLQLLDEDRMESGEFFDQLAPRLEKRFGAALILPIRQKIERYDLQGARAALLPLKDRL